MKIKRVRYGMTRQAKNTGSRFDHDRIDVELELEDDETFDAAKQQAKALCLIGLGHVDAEDVAKARELVKLFDKVQS